MPRSVRKSADLLRILEIPRREIGDWEELREGLTRHLRTPEGTMSLRMPQAWGLAEGHDHGGMFFQASVGQGKTLLSMLLPVICKAERPMLFVPAKLKVKTSREFGELRKHWQFQQIWIESYELLGRVSGAQMLDRRQPDCIILDEAHCVKNPRAACTRRLHRYIHDRRKAGHPLRVFAMSGTLSKRSLRDFAHIMFWCLPAGYPLPVNWPDLEEWSCALDEKVLGPDRTEPGKLLLFCNEEELKLDPLSAARKGVSRRIFETPGILSTKNTEHSVSASLTVEVHEVPVGIEADGAFQTLRGMWETPDGWPISDGVTMWRHARELALGFYYKWHPRPPQDWLTARRNWCAAVREILANNRRDLDTELQVALEVYRFLEGGKHHEAGQEYEDWHKIKDTFRPNTVPVWIDTHALEFAEDWARKNTGVIWIEHKAFGEKLQELTKLAYYQNQGKDRRGRLIEDADPRSSLIASIASNGTGRNLQAWSSALVTCAPPTGTLWEQLLGRLHRPGQSADVVTYDVLVACREQLAGFEQARRDCIYLQDTLSAPMKLCYADTIIPDIQGKGYAWR